MLIPMGPGGRGRHLGLQIEEKDLGPEMYSAKLRGLRLKAGNVIAVDGAPIPTKVVDAGEMVIIHLPHLAKPQKNHFILSFNPTLLDYGMVSMAPVMDYESVREGNIFLRFHADRMCDISELPYVFEIYMVE